MNDAELIAMWSALEPDGRRRARIETRVSEWLEASDTSLTSEWMELLRVEPVTSVAFAALGAMALVLLTPVGWMTAWLFG